MHDGAGRGAGARAPGAGTRPRPTWRPRHFWPAIEANLGKEPLGVDELVRRCDARLAEVQAVLLELELEGRLDRHPGNRVTLRAG